MVVNVDHLCPACLGIGRCELCNRGIIRAPAGTVIPKPGVCLIRVNEPTQDDIDLALDKWQNSKDATRVGCLPTILTVMLGAFEAGYRAGRASK